MVYINLISGLATQNPATDNEVYVQGYYSINDGYGGYFIFKTTAELPSGTTPDQGIWFNYTGGGGLWERQFSKEGPINVKWFGARGDGTSLDAAYVQKTIYFASSFGYSVFVPKGTFLVDTILLPSNVLIAGEGDLSILQYTNDAADYIFKVDTQDSSVTNNIQNVRIADICFYSSINTFSEHKYFICLNGASNFIIEKCFFKQFRGDAIYIGSGVGVLQVCHNENITIRDCRFDGVNQANRNAVTILDCNHLLIENNSIKNTTRSDMPGAIDIEPNGTGNEILKDIIVQNNYFYNIGGISACCSVNLSTIQFAVTPSGFYFLNNYMENVFSGFQLVYRYVPAGGIDTKIKLPFFIENNVIIAAVENGFFLYGACSAQVKSNYINAGYGSSIGFLNTYDTATDVIVTNNYFDKCGTQTGKGLNLFNCNRVKLISNIFNDCGANPPGAGANAIDFNVNSTSNYIDIEQNIFLSPTGKTAIAIQKESTHTFTPRNNRFFNNQFAGLTNYFQWINDNNFGLAIGITPAPSVTIPHQLGSTPKWATVQPQSNNVAGIKNVIVDATNITVTFTVTPVGTVSLYWSVQA